MSKNAVYASLAPQPCGVLSQLQAVPQQRHQSDGPSHGPPHSPRGITAALHTSASSPRTAFHRQQVLATGALIALKLLCQRFPLTQNSVDTSVTSNISSVEMVVWLCERTARRRLFVLQGGPIRHGERELILKEFGWKARSDPKPGGNF